MAINWGMGEGGTARRLGCWEAKRMGGLRSLLFVGRLTHLRRHSTYHSCLAGYGLEKSFVRFVITYPKPRDNIILEDCKGTVIKRNPQ